MRKFKYRQKKEIINVLSSNLFLENKTSRGLKTLEKTANSLINNRKKYLSSSFKTKVKDLDKYCAL